MPLIPRRGEGGLCGAMFKCSHLRNSSTGISSPCTTLTHSSHYVTADMAHRSGRRMPISCEPCRTRKIRCPRSDNSNGPCASCIRRGLRPSQCVYLRHSYDVAQHTPSSSNASSNEELLDRIRALEDLVQGQNSAEGTGRPIIFQRNQTPTSPDIQAGSSSSVAPLSERTPPPAGVLRFFNGGYQRFEPHGSQWSSVLDPTRAPVAIHGLEASDANSTGDHPFDLGAGVNVEDLIAQLPPQKQCDELKNVFLNVFAPVSDRLIVL